ncbi:diguanylate cyclase domain-containing protein [Herminiimonas aquatilis]|uniref:Diguanylate cyclase domain-containing protein n=1 Tax=Herminiimonas aquatilis TaxID=345342 RepID=A0ABW2J6R0_9BURK
MRVFHWFTSLSNHTIEAASEFAQAKLRAFNVTPFCLYMILAWHFQWHSVSKSVAIGAAGYIAYAFIWIFVVRFSLLGVTLRRTMAAILDQALPALGMYLAGYIAGLVAWVPALGSIGSGLRYGTKYTWLSSIVGGPLMATAFYFSSDWSTIPSVAGGIVLVNVLVPLYVVALVQKLEDAKQTFELRAAHFEEATKRDYLTGLLNRAGFADELEQLFGSGAASGEIDAVLLLDLDGFKAINDACGHAGGDAILKEVALSLTHCVRISDKVARLGGDEFGVLLRHIVSEKSAEAVVAKMLKAIAEISLARKDLRLGASVGICVLPHADLRTVEDVLKSADSLMYQAKAAGKNQFRTAVPASVAFAC